MDLAMNKGGMLYVGQYDCIVITMSKYVSTKHTTDPCVLVTYEWII